MTDNRTRNSMADIKDIRKIYHKKSPLPIDRGWAWFVMIGAYVIMLVAFSLGRSLSVFLPDILDHYNQPATVTTLAFGVGDISWSLTNIAIPALLLPHFSVRTLALCGAISYSCAVVALAYSENIIMFNCLFAVFGCAGGLMVVTSLIHLGHFFKKRLSFASAVAQIGSSTSMVLIPQLAQSLKDTYGYQGAMLILGGLSFHCVAAAMLLRPVSMFEETSNPQELPVGSSKNGIQALGDIDPIDMAIIVKSPEEEEEEEAINDKSNFLQIIDLKPKQLNESISTSDLKITKYTDNINRQLQSVSTDGVKNSDLTTLFKASITRSTSQSTDYELQALSSHLPDSSLDSKVSNQSDNYHQNEHLVSNQNDDNVAYLDAANKEAQKHYAIPDPTDKYERRSSMEENVSNQTALIQGGSHSHQESTTAVTSGCCCSLHKIKAYLSSSVLLNPLAVMLVVAGGLSTTGGNMYIPVLGLENGLSTEEVPWMLLIIGISDILGKLGVGFFADLGYVRPIRIASITQFTVGMVCQFTTFYKGFGPMAGMAIIFGMMNGVVQSLLPSMVIELLGLPYLAQVTSIFYLATGVSTCILNVAVGAIKDATRSFRGGFNFLGGMLLTSFALMLLEPVFVKCRDKFSKHAKNSH